MVGLLLCQSLVIIFSFASAILPWRALAFSSPILTSTSGTPKTPSPSSAAAATRQHLEPGQVLLPSTASDPTQFDTACVVNPVVLPPCGAYDKWQMYYYGNAGKWNDGSRGFLPTGWIGLAESDDGIHWIKIAGSSANGAVMAPSENPDDWDTVHIGVGDVVRMSNEELHMYYFGGGTEIIDNFGPSGASFSGFRMRIGRARSFDNGRTWERMGMVLDYDESEGLFASWPRIVVPQDKDKPWQMIYHAFDGKIWRVFGATSTDKGGTWKRRGILLDAGIHRDSFDALGIGTRAVAGPWRGGMLMVYEAVCPKGKHRLGAAYCADPNGEGDWVKLQGSSLKHEGGPIAEPGKGAMREWTSFTIGTPYLVSRPDGALWMYHCGKTDDKGHSIGLVTSETGDVMPDAWKPVNA